MNDRQMMDGEHAAAEDLHAQIAQRAYALWQERGGGDGQDLNDWLTAEGEIGGCLEDAQQEGKTQT